MAFYEVTNALNYGGPQLAFNVPRGQNWGEYLFWNSKTSSWNIGSSNINLGLNAGKNNIHIIHNSVYLGNNAGTNNLDGLQNVSIGYKSYNCENTGSIGCVAVGAYASQTGAIGQYSVAVGHSAGQINQQNNTVSIGHNSGQDSQGEYSVAVGTNAGQSNQNTSSIAIGNSAGQSNQNTSSVAIGSSAGQHSQGNYSIAIGNSAGQFSQGTNCVAIGNRAGPTGQPNNSIILNAINSDLNVSHSGLWINPIRLENTNIYSNLSYNPTSSEITYSNVGSVLKITMLAFNEINQSASTLINNGSWQQVAYYNYTPVSDSSKIIVEYCSQYIIGGDNYDEFYSQITVDTVQISRGFQRFNNVSGDILNLPEGGGGTRSGTIFPLMGKVNNYNQTTKLIKINALEASDDYISIYGDDGTWLKITEISA